MVTVTKPRVELPDSAVKSRVEILGSIMDQKDQEELWALYHAAFKKLNLSSPCRQSLNYQEFILAMRESNISKYVLHGEKGEPVGLSLVTNRLELIPWLSLPYFEKEFPNEFNERKIYYFIGTAVNDEYRLKRGGIQIFYAVVDSLPLDCIAAYDYTENSETGMDRLGLMIARRLKSEGRIIDKQVYWLGRRKAA